MAGSISLSLSQVLDLEGVPLAGGTVSFFEAGTTTPQSAYQDFNLAFAHPNPITLPASGRVPQLYFADGFIKYEIRDADGVLQDFVNDYVLVQGPSIGEGEGGGGGVDPTSVWQTGDLKARYGTGAHSGFVRANGRTVGSATSGGTERANSDCQALFIYLWGADANLSVSGGRGASGAADWAVNKTIALPDWAGYTLTALDDLGAGSKNRLTAAYFGTAANVLGAVGGAESNTLSIAKIPLITPAGTVAVTVNPQRLTFTNLAVGAGGGVAVNFSGAVNFSDTAIATATATGSFTGTQFGGGEAHNNVQPTKLATIYIRL
jgi:hypothetical protein